MKSNLRKVRIGYQQSKKHNRKDGIKADIQAKYTKKALETLQL